jgi:copper chaperone CopZ
MFTESCFIPTLADAVSAHTITTALASIQGVRHLHADVPNHRLVLTYEHPATPDLLRDTIERLGYTVAQGLNVV